MISLNARISYKDNEHSSAVVSVRTARCFYQVAIKGEEITIIGPGVNKSFTNEEVPENLTNEGKAAVAVLLFEEET